MRRINVAAVLGLLIGIVAVSGCDLFSDSISGRVILRLTDAPLKADAINVSLTGLTLVDTKSGERESIDLGAEARDINLLEYQGGSTLTLADHPVGIARFDQLRLLVAEEGSIQIDGVVYDLRIPSGTSAGVKILLKESVELGGGTFDIKIDFDAYESVVLLGPPNAPKGYLLKPVIRPVSASLNESEVPLSLLPVIDDPGDQIGKEGDLVLLGIRAVDPDKDRMTFAADGLPPGLSIDGDSGEITGTLIAAGEYEVTVSVSDDDGIARVSFRWSVSSAGPRGWIESAVVTGVASDRWTTVSLSHEYGTMVAVCTVLYINNAGPVLVRLRNASGSSFDVRIQNPRGALLAREQVHCLVAEAGTWQLPDGRRFEATRYESTLTDENDSWMGEERSYAMPFTNPVVLGQVMSYNDPDWSVFWSRGATTDVPPSADHLWTGKHSGEDLERGRGDEQIGYFVLEAGSGRIGDVEYRIALGPDVVQGVSDGPPFLYEFDVPFAATPAVGVATMAGMEGRDGGWAILYRTGALSATRLHLAIDEDRLRDSERSHPAEQVAYAVFAETLNTELRAWVSGQ